MNYGKRHDLELIKNHLLNGQIQQVQINNKMKRPIWIIT